MNSREFFRSGCLQPILVTAAIFCLSLAGLAQPIYSINVLAYVDASFAAGSNLVANPLSAPENTISRLFRGVPDGSLFLPWDGGTQTFRPTNSYSNAGGWTDSEASLLLPNGGLLWLPTAKKITFVGEVFQGSLIGHTYPAGLWVLSVIPRDGSIFCQTFDECPAQPPTDTTLSKWNRITQRYETYTYLGPQTGFGWVDENFNPVDVKLEPAESGLFSVPTSFWVPEFSGTSQTNDSLRVTLQHVRHDGTNVTFRFAATNGTPYSLFRCTDLTLSSWELVQQGNAIATDGFTTVTNASGTNQNGFYRVRPQNANSVPYLTNPSREGTQFRFDFYASTATVYQIQRTGNLTPPNSMWQTIKSVTATPNSLVTVMDTNATAATGYYRIQY